MRLRGACADLWSCQPGWVQANQIRKRFALHRGRGIELRLLINPLLASFPAIVQVMAADRSLSSLQTIHLLDSSLWLQTRPGYVAVDQHASKIGEG